MAPPSEPLTLARLRQRASDGAATDRPSPDRLQANIGALLYEVARGMRRRFERRARQTGLPITRLQARVMLCIARNEGESQAAVATLLDIEPIALVRALDRLHAEGLVDRRRHATDRRVWTLWITAQGWRVVQQVLAINQDIRDETCAGLTADERSALFAMLDRMKANLSIEDEAASEAV